MMWNGGSPERLMFSVTEATPQKVNFRGVEYEDPSTLLADTLEFIENKVVNAISASRNRLVELTEVEKKAS